MLKTITLSLPFLVSLFWTVYFLFGRKRNSRAQNIWLIAMCIITIEMGVYGAYWGYEGYNYIIDAIDPFAMLSFMPVVFLYFRELTGDKSKRLLTLKVILLFLPAALIGGATVFVYLFFGEETATLFIAHMSEYGTVEGFDAVSPTVRLYQSITECLYSASLLIQVFVVMIYAYRRLSLYRSRLKDFFSNLDHTSLVHYWAALWGFLALFVLLLFISTGGYMLYVEYSVQVSVVMIAFSVIIYFICYHISLSSHTAADFARELELSDKEASEKENLLIAQLDVQGVLNAKMIPKLNSLMDEEQLFLQADLRIDDVARLLRTNRTYVSRLIREQYQCNFSEFVNLRRIEYAKALVRSNPQLSQEQISEQSGFAHTTYFSRVFKQYEGVTFREFMKIGL